MIIYVDILLFLNAVIDYFLILAASALTARKIKEKRLIIACLFASVTSLYIFAPETHPIIDLLIRILISMAVTFVAFGFKSFSLFLKSTTAVIAVTFLYNGIAVAFWNIFKPNSMVIKNNVVYLNISAIEMIGFSLLGYILIRIGKFLACRFSPHAKRVDISFINQNSLVETKALVDSGNSLKDIYFGKNVVITDIKTASEIFCDIKTKTPLLLPFESIGGNGMIKAYYCDAVKIGNKTLDKTLVAVCEKNFEGDYRAIVSPEITEG